MKIRRIFQFASMIPFALNAQLTVDPGPEQAVYTNDTPVLSVAADGGSGAYAYAWSVIDGDPVVFGDAASATTTYSAATAGTRVFQITVTDTANGAAETATATHHVHAKFKAPVMIDFGTRTPLPEDAAISPAHQDGILSAANDVHWISRTGAANTRMPDLLTGAFDSQNNPVGLSVIGGGALRSPVPNYENKPVFIAGTQNAAGGAGVMSGSIMSDFVRGADVTLGSADYLFFRFRGFEPGLYAVYCVSRNTSSPVGWRWIRAAAGTEQTVFSPTFYNNGPYQNGWDDEDMVSYATDAERTLGSWADGVNYKLLHVNVTANEPDILLVTVGRVYAADGLDSGVLNAVQIVPLHDIGAEFSCASTSGVSRAPTVIEFDASASTGVGAIEYTWNFGDGSQPFTTNAAHASHYYDYPGSYAVSLSVKDSLNQIVSTNMTLVLSGNRRPVASAGVLRAAFTGETIAMKGSATDPDGNALSFAWTQTAGPSVLLPGADTATPSFCAAAPGTYVFTLSVTDNGEPPRTSFPSVVTNLVHEPANVFAPVMLDFGATTAIPDYDAVNSPAHAEGLLKQDDVFWNRQIPAPANNTPVASMYSDMRNSRGNPVNVIVKIGSSKTNRSTQLNPAVLVPDYDGQMPRNNNGSAASDPRSGVGVMRSSVMSDFAAADEGRSIFVCLRGFAPGKYDVFTVSRNTGNGVNPRYTLVKAGSGTDETQLVSAWDTSLKTGYADAGEMALGTWTEGVNYRKDTVRVNADAPDILIVASGLCWWGAVDNGDGSYGVINAIQIVPSHRGTLLMVK